MSSSAFFSDAAGLRAVFASAQVPKPDPKKVAAPPAAATPAQSTGSLPSAAAEAPKPTTTVGSGLPSRTTSTVSLSSSQVTIYEYTPIKKTSLAKSKIFEIIRDDTEVSTLVALGTEDFLGITVGELKDLGVVDFGSLCRKVRPGECKSITDKKVHFKTLEAVLSHGCLFSFLVPSLANNQLKMVMPASSGSIIELYEASKDSYALYNARRKETMYETVTQLAKLACASVLRHLQHTDDVWSLDQDGIMADPIIADMLALWKKLACTKGRKALEALNIHSKHLTVHFHNHKITIQSISDIQFESQ